MGGGAGVVFKGELLKGSSTGQRHGSAEGNGRVPFPVLLNRNQKDHEVQGPRRSKTSMNDLERRVGSRSLEGKFLDVLMSERGRVEEGPTQKGRTKIRRGITVCGDGEKQGERKSGGEHRLSVDPSGGTERKKWVGSTSGGRGKLGENGNKREYV